MLAFVKKNININILPTQAIEYWLIKCPTIFRIHLPVSEILRKILYFFVHNSSTGPNFNNSNNSLINNNSIVNNSENSLANNTVSNNSSVLNNVFILFIIFPNRKSINKINNNFFMFLLGGTLAFSELQINRRE